MFNIFEGNKDETARKLQERLEILKRARENGFFDEKRTEPMPEIVADGHGPDDRNRPSPFVKKHSAEPRPTPKGANPAEPDSNTAVLPPTEVRPRPYQPMQWCPNCDKATRHVTYGGQGSPPWHCCVCCTCDPCMATVERQATEGRDVAIDRERAREQVKYGHQALCDAITTPDPLLFCTGCGAGLRCTVCEGTGTGNYCTFCGRRNGEEGFCTDCWEEADLDG